MTEQMYTTDTAAERLTREVAEAVESGGRFSRAEFSVDDVSTVLGELADMQSLAQVNAMNYSDYAAAMEDAKEARAALAAVQQPNRETLESALFYVGDDGKHVFNFADDRVTLEDDPYLRDLIPAILAVLPIPATAADEWCHEESCRYRNWRSGSMPTHKRGADCPEPAIPATGEDAEPCDAELWSWDYFKHQQVDAYWMRCRLVGEHDEHENSETGAHWKAAVEVTP